MASFHEQSRTLTDSTGMYLSPCSGSIKSCLRRGSVWSWTWIHDPSDGGMDWLFHNERLSFFPALFPLSFLLLPHFWSRTSTWGHPSGWPLPRLSRTTPFSKGALWLLRLQAGQLGAVFEGKGKSCNVLSEFLKDWTAELAQVAMSTKGFAKQPVRTSQRGWKETLSWRGLHGNN